MELLEVRAEMFGARVFRKAFLPKQTYAFVRWTECWHGGCINSHRRDQLF
jgi:hypothetical protein